MKKIFLILSFIIGANAMVNAQLLLKSPDQRAARITRVLQKKLNLTADQASQINVVFLGQATRMDSLKNNLSTDSATNRLTRRSIFLTGQRQVMSILNDDQRKQYLAWEQMRKEKHMQKKYPDDDLKIDITN